jgi:branched-chain amino acid transport system substrate-binding protein
VPASPVIVASQLPETHPAKKRAEEYIRLYEAAYGPGSVAAFGSYTWDACLGSPTRFP